MAVIHIFVPHLHVLYDQHIKQISNTVYHMSFGVLVTVFILVELSIFGSNLCEKHLHSLYMLDIAEVWTLWCMNRPIQYGYIFLFLYVFNLM